MWRHPKQGVAERRGETDIRLITDRLITERQILIHAAAVITGVVAGIELDLRGMIIPTTDSIVGPIVAVGFVSVAFIVRSRRLWPLLSVVLSWFIMGLVAVQLQLARLPPVLMGDGQDLRISGQVEQLDGRYDSRLRLWLRVHEIHDAAIGSDATPLARLTGHVVRLSFGARDHEVQVGEWLTISARLYPPPSRVLASLPDYRLRARAAGVVASGYVRSMQAGEAREDKVSAHIWLDRVRQRRADAIRAAMTQPEGGIAAALLIGDRRFVSQETYDLFRQSGLAHLLAISGLHMGLLCFGVVACMRRAMALFPHLASRLPVHKIAAAGGLIAGLLYVLLSGASVSAVRAFLMAMLVILSWMIDRPGITLRNVGIAAIIILLINPLAIQSAGFQLSFAATTGLVVWYDRVRSYGGGNVWPKPLRWAGGLMLASLIASSATLPLTAQHFGAVTPWGVIANLGGIPLTGLWIMPAGLAVLITEFLPVPALIHDISLMLMQTGINVLVRIAGWFASFPLSPLYLSPPGWVVLLPLAMCSLVLACFELRRAGRVAVIMLSGSIAVWLLAMRPAIDAVLFVRHGHTALVLPGQERSLSIHLAADVRREAISGFLADHAALALGVADGGNERDRAWLSIAGQVAVVTHPAKLTEACGSDVKLVLSMVPARYPCKDSANLYNLHEVKYGNYLISFNHDSLILTERGSQYFRMSPVSRP